MTGGAPGSDDEPDDLQFRSLSAPGLEEDDVFAALHGLPVPSPFWGDGWPAAADRDPDRPWDEAAERRRRHEDLLAKWRDEREGGAGPAARPDGPPAPPP